MKIFCIGFNKTGTTSLEEFFSMEGFKVPNQKHFKQNLDSYRFNNYSTFINIIKEDYPDYNFFQDVPFSLPNFYKTLYSEFPNSYFILTVRDSGDQWYNSLINFYRNSFPNRFHLPSKIEYCRPKWIYQFLTEILGSPKYDPYDKESLTKCYENHIKDVEDFFKDKGNLIKINLSNSKDFKRLEKFLNVEFSSNSFPHLNRSK